MWQQYKSIRRYGFSLEFMFQSKCILKIKIENVIFSNTNN